MGSIITKGKYGKLIPNADLLEINKHIVYMVDDGSQWRFSGATERLKIAKILEKGEGSVIVGYTKARKPRLVAFEEIYRVFDNAESASNFIMIARIIYKDIREELISIDQDAKIRSNIVKSKYRNFMYFGDDV